MTARQISAKVLADSTSSETGQRIVTFELEYPRIIHSENMTHRVASKNSASTRAVPTPKAVEHVRNNTFMPVWWGKNQSGMSAREELNAPVIINGVSLTREEAWLQLRDVTCQYVEAFHEAGYHKQIIARPLEVFSIHKIVYTATDYSNFFWLRDHEDAQPEIQVLAREMKAAYQSSITTLLNLGDWHTPYYKNGYWREVGDTKVDAYGYTRDQALKISTSMCAQVSYRVGDATIEKADNIYVKLMGGDVVHASPLEHQASPTPATVPWTDIPGVTHIDKQGRIWSGNLCNWIQHRQLIMEEKGLSPMTGAPRDYDISLG